MTGDEHDLAITVVSVGALAWVLTDARLIDWRARRRLRRQIRRANRRSPDSG